MNRSFFYTWNLIKKYNTKNIILNFGPQHPAAHGVLRLILQLEGEIIQRTDIHIGLLHRGSESLIESKHYEKSIPYFDRMDYCSMLTQEHAFVLAIENLMGVTGVSYQINLVRILFDELTRILNHFLAIACHALDIGSMSSIFWGFEEREKLMEIYERVSGARMHAAYHKPLSIFSSLINKNLINDILWFVQNCFTTLNEMHNVLTYNKIWKQRLVNIGVFTPEFSSQFNLTGVMARSVGVKKDLRLSVIDSYSGYNTITFKSYIGVNGDCFDRYLIRMLEIGESLQILNSSCYKLTESYPITAQAVTLVWNDLYQNKVEKLTYTSMEDLINHFLKWHTGVSISKNINTTFIESPKGEFGITLLANNTTLPAKCKVKSPSYYNLQALPSISKGHFLADIAALIGTIDIVFGEIDR